MIKVYGASDDLVEIGGSEYREIDAINSNVRIWFEDGTVILVGYGKEELGIWWVKVEKEGSANYTLEICEDEDAQIYSDIFRIDSTIKRYKVVKGK